MRPALPLAERLIVQLPTGEYVCIDTRSLEALAFALGWEHEAEVIQLVRGFLTPRSVFLDIGANFGLYTAIVGPVVGEHGRLFAFEGNPLAFATLRRTIAANRLFDNPRIIAADCLVSDRCGRGTLYYAEDFWASGTMTDLPLVGGPRRSVEAAMTTIDAVLPPELAVDLVKIDVEGHEPLVIRGMAETIARSPGIRLIIEFADHMLTHTMPAAEFADYLRALGFALCRISSGPRLALIPADEAIIGFNHLLLTRTPAEDIAIVERWRNRPAARLKRALARRLPDWRRYRRMWQQL